jgi:hypothetical protein
MHDQQLERNLRTALRAEGDGLALTITAAELERRLALRRRGRPNLASLGLAAGIAIGLIGLAGVMSGWFDERAVVVPPPTATTSPAASQITVPSASAPTATASLPTLDDLIASGDPDSVVLAQQYGPAEGQPKGAAESPSVDLGPLAGPADYEIRYACISGSEPFLFFEPIPPTGGALGVPDLACDGAIRTATVHVDGPVRLVTGSATPASWRFVVRPAVANGAPHVSAISPLSPDDAEEVLVQNQGQHPEPDYGAILTGGGVVTPVEVGGVPSRENYRVRVSCGGPTTLSYTFGQSGGETGFVSYVTTQVPCDGAIHEGRFDIPLPNGAMVFVATDDRDAWSLLVTTEAPPVSMAPNEGGWTMSMAIGPTLEFDPHSFSLNSAVGGPVHEIRVVVSCLGGHSVAVTVASSKTQVYTSVGSFTVSCEPSQVSTSSKIFRLPAATFEVTAQPDSKMWLAVTVQERAAAGEAP